MNSVVGLQLLLMLGIHTQYGFEFLISLRCRKLKKKEALGYLMSVCRTLGGPSVQRTVNVHSSNSHVKPILMMTVMKEMGG